MKFKDELVKPTRETGHMGYSKSNLDNSTINAANHLTNVCEWVPFSIKMCCVVKNFKS